MCRREMLLMKSGKKLTGWIILRHETMFRQIKCSCDEWLWNDYDNSLGIFVVCCFFNIWFAFYRSRTVWMLVTFLYRFVVMYVCFSLPPQTMITCILRVLCIHLICNNGSAYTFTANEGCCRKLLPSFRWYSMNSSIYLH